MQRGQAFDAFKLLIAAVVAGAILVILLSMIGGFVPVGQDPLTVMGQELTKVKKGGVASTSSQTVQFSQGEEFESDAVAKEAGVNKGQIFFCCDQEVGDATSRCDNYQFNEHDAFECSSDGDLLVVVEDISGKIRAYCPTSDNPCIIGFKVSR